MSVFRVDGHESIAERRNRRGHLEVWAGHHGVHCSARQVGTQRHLDDVIECRRRAA